MRVPTPHPSLREIPHPLPGQHWPSPFHSRLSLRDALPLSTAFRKNSSKYALTRIYVIWHILIMENAFDIVAEPNRLAILSLLTLNEQSVGEIERQLRMSQP